ncbi:MAG: ABC transporter substrate-binding protein [Chloroflexales bacterium]|nr:ABC transporter substrate-binding protein [Chloroflexales bacterium]
MKIGLLLPYSKVYAALGLGVTNGMTLYFEQAGMQAGGRPITVIREDEENDPQIALTKTRKFIESDKVDLIAGVVSTAVAYGIRDLVDSAKTHMIIANAGGNDLTRKRKSPYIFRASFTSWQVSNPLGKWVADNLTKEAYISAADYAFGHESADAFKESFQAAGGTILGEVYPKLGATDYAPFLTQIAQAKPKYLYNFYSGADALNFLRQFGQYGLGQTTKLLGAGFFVEQDVLPGAGDVPLGAVSSLHWAVTLDNPENQKFVADYKARFSSDADVFALQGYDTARTIVEAVNARGGDTSDKEALSKALAAVSFQSPRGKFRFDPDTHQVIQDIYIREVRQVENAHVNVVIDKIADVRDPG